MRIEDLTITLMIKTKTLPCKFGFQLLKSTNIDWVKVLKHPRKWLLAVKVAWQIVCLDYKIAR